MDWVLRGGEGGRRGSIAPGTPAADTPGAADPARWRDPGAPATASRSSARCTDSARDSRRRYGPPGLPALHRLGLHEVSQTLPVLRGPGKRDPEKPKGGREPAASPPASAGSVEFDSQLTLRSQHARHQLGLRRQQRLGGPRRMASEFSDGAQDIPGTQQEARNGTHEEPGCHLLTRERHAPGVP